MESMCPEKNPDKIKRQIIDWVEFNAYLYLSRHSKLIMLEMFLNNDVSSLSLSGI